MIEKNNLSIFLIKQEFTDVDDILKPGHRSLTLEEGKLLYFQTSEDRNPDWIRTFFKSDEQLATIFSNSNSRSVLLETIDYESASIIFALTFGYGRHMINDESIEHSFGLKAAVNLIGPDKIRSISKNNINNDRRNSKQQLVRDNTITDFEFDRYGDLISSITGKSNNSFIEDTYITGSTSFRANVSYDITNIQEFLEELYTIYLKDDYRESFDWIDNIKGVKSKPLIEKLDELLLIKINSGDNNVFMALPSLINFEHFKGVRIRPTDEIKNDLVIQDVLDSFRNPVTKMKQFKSRNIELISAVTDEAYTNVNSYNCLLGEIEYEGDVYTINDGNWYSIKNDYVNAINEKFNDINISDIDFISSDIDEYEEDYNKKMCDSDTENYYLMDKEYIYVDEGHNKVEFCDIITLDKKLIHIKRKIQSNTLSHLFNQGIVSSELLKHDNKFLRDVNSKILDSRFHIEHTDDFEVVYAIISNVGTERPYIPFFSRVTLTNAVEKLTRMSYKVSIKRIEV